LGQFSAKVRVAEVARDWPNRHLGPEGQRWEGPVRERIAELARSVDGTGASAERVQARMGTERDELRRERGALRERIGTLDTDIRAPEFARGCLIQRGFGRRAGARIGHRAG
jgi:hypothetical protein